MRLNGRILLVLATMALGALAPAPAALAAGVPDLPPLVVSQYQAPNGWLLRPAGTQVDTRRTADGVAVSPDGRTVYAVNAGQLDHALTSFDATGLIPLHNPVPELFMGVAADGAGNVWASGGSSNRIWQFKAVGPATVGLRHIGLAPGTPNNGIKALAYPGNMVLGRDGRLFVAGNLSVPNDAIKAFDPQAAACADSTVCSAINVVDVSDTSPTASPPVHLVPVGRDAYGLALNPVTGRLYVTNWADEVNDARAGGTGTVSIVDVSRKGEEREIAVVPVGHHPTGIALSPDGHRLVVTNAADDSLSILELDDAGDVASTRTIRLRAPAGGARGITPLAAAFSPDGTLLYVALAGLNAVQVRAADGDSIPRTVTVAGGHEVHVPDTYIPTGWYPAALAVGPNPAGSGSRLYVANLKGMGDGPGFNELITGVRSQGSVSAIDVPPAGDARAEQLDRWTATVVENNDWTAHLLGTPSPASDACEPVPLPDGSTALSGVICDAASGKLDPRRLHVLYIVKENKTFDQYFGDIKATLPDADASPEWLLYGEAVTTNQHRLARRFAINDRFWADSEQSTLGHSWTSAGYATDFNELTWSTSGGYDEGLRGDRWGGQYDGQTSGPRDAEVARGEAELERPERRLVDQFADPATNPTGATFRIYSDDVDSDSPAKAQRVPLGLWGVGPSAVGRGRDLDFPDTDRAAMFLRGETISRAWSLDKGAPPDTFGKRIAFSDADRERFTLAAWERRYDACRTAGGTDASCQEAMPNFIYMALPIDHTLGFNPYTPTPPSMVADNDYAVGQIIEALSKTPFWRTTLVVITEDDTQASGDHVDPHRTFVLTAGGLSRELGRKGLAAHQVSSFPSILKTIEAMFRIPPLTIFDSAAAPLHSMVVPSLEQANTARYRAVRPPTPFVMNEPDTLLGALSQTMSWELDETDPGLMFDLLYAGLRGRPLPREALERLPAKVLAKLPASERALAKRALSGR